MKVLLFLGSDAEYLGYKKFTDEKGMDKFLNAFEDILIMNIEKEVPLKERIALAKKMGIKYFPFMGAVQDIEVIDTENDNEQR